MFTAQTELQAEVTIPAEPGVVWAAFCQIEAWPQWYPGVLAAHWQQGQPWATGAVMVVQVKNSLGVTVRSLATVQRATDNSLLWENRATGLITLCRVEVAAVAGGSQITLHKSYRGAATPLLLLLKARQQRMLAQGLATLKALILALY